MQDLLLVYERVSSARVLFLVYRIRWYKRVPRTRKTKDTQIAINTRAFEKTKTRVLNQPNANAKSAHAKTHTRASITRTRKTVYAYRG